MALPGDCHRGGPAARHVSRVYLPGAGHRLQNTRMQEQDVVPAAERLDSARGSGVRLAAGSRTMQVPGSRRTNGPRAAR